MRIAICDDDKKCIETASRYLEQIGEADFEYDTFPSGEDLLKVYRKSGCVFDAVFLDMEMDGANGINVANEIRNMDRHVIIVFVTSHTKYMQESFVCSPFRFLVKPVSFEDFKKVFFKILDRIEEDKLTLSFSEDRVKVRLLYEDILFLQSINHHTCIQARDKLHTTYTALSELAAQLNTNIFVQVHRSYIININYIRAVSKSELFVRGYNHPIPVSDKYRDELERKVFLFEERKRLI